MPIRITERRHFNQSGTGAALPAEAAGAGAVPAAATQVRLPAGFAAGSGAAFNPSSTNLLACSPTQLTGVDPLSGLAVSRYQDLAGATVNAKMDAAPVANLISLPAGTVVSNDFAAGSIASIIPSYSDLGAGLVGTGIDSTIIAMGALTSTHAADVPSTGTNQIYVGYFNRNGLILRCLTFKGNDQGHDFNGIRLDNIAGPTLANLKFVGMCKGSNFFPPGETFVIGSNHCSDLLYQDVEIDGRFDGATGKGVAASGFGDNSFTNGVWNRAKAHHCNASAAFAMWQGVGQMNMYDCSGDFCRTNLGFERIGREAVGLAPARVDVYNFSFGQYTINEPLGTGQDIFLGNDQGSTQLWLHDPVLKPGRTTAPGRNPARAFVFYPVNEQGNPNRQLKSDVHVTFNGVEVPNTDFLEWSR